MNHDELFINGDLLRLRREARGWVLADMATRACMSIKQIRQLEEGGVSAFYSEAVKATAAKKVGVLLGLSAHEVFGHQAQTDATPDDASRHEVSTPAVVDQFVSDGVVPTDDLPQAQVPLESTAENTELPQSEPAKAKTSIWVIAGLFAAALALAALMQPKEEAATEAPPPLQPIPSEAADAASAAEAAASAASAAEQATSSSGAQKSTSSGTAASAVMAVPAVPSALPTASKSP